MANVLISIPNNKEEFDFLGNIHQKLIGHFKAQVDSLNPVNLLDINQYLAQVFHLSKQQTKIIINSLSEKSTP